MIDDYSAILDLAFTDTDISLNWSIWKKFVQNVNMTRINCNITSELGKNNCNFSREDDKLYVVIPDEVLHLNTYQI